MEKCSFFNSIDHDRVYDSADFAAYYGDLFCNGVIFDTDTALLVHAGEGFIIRVDAGSCWINGYRYFNTGTFELNADLPMTSLKRIDRAVVRWDLAERRMYLAIVKGVESANPVPPPLTRGASVWELGLAEIYIAPTAAQITDNDIVDTRLNPTLCGLATTRSHLSFGQPDTETLLRLLETYQARILKLENQDTFTVTENVLWNYYSDHPANAPRYTAWRVDHPMIRAGCKLVLAGSPAAFVKSPYNGTFAHVDVRIAGIVDGSCLLTLATAYPMTSSKLPDNVNNYLPWPKNTSVSALQMTFTFLVWY